MLNHLQAESVHLLEVGLLELHHTADRVALVRLLRRPTHCGDKYRLCTRKGLIKGRHLLMMRRKKTFAEEQDHLTNTLQI